MYVYVILLEAFKTHFSLKSPNEKLKIIASLPPIPKTGLKTPPSFLKYIYNKLHATYQNDQIIGF